MGRSLSSVHGCQAANPDASRSCRIDLRKWACQSAQGGLQTGSCERCAHQEPHAARSDQRSTFLKVRSLPSGEAAIWFQLDANSLCRCSDDSLRDQAASFMDGLSSSRLLKNPGDRAVF